MSKIPVLVLAFNRPDHVAKALEAIREYCPDHMYLACDGPREKETGEEELVSKTHETMLHAIDWDCNVKTLFREKNLGCANAVYEAITWFFKHEEYGIIIEDDVVVSHDFFKLCENLLPRYAKENRIMEITAQNHSRRRDIPNTYVYTETSHCWGWATWKRAWEKMDMSMSAANKISLFDLTKRLGLFKGVMMKHYFKSAYNHLPTFNSWATRWYLSVLSNQGLVICPGVNLAVNIGMDGGTHYQKGDKNPYANLKNDFLTWPILYNDSLLIDKKQKKYESQDFLKVRLIGVKKMIRRVFA